jgi:hypothetical protein
MLNLYLLVLAKLEEFPLQYSLRFLLSAITASNVFIVLISVLLVLGRRFKSQKVRIYFKRLYPLIPVPFIKNKKITRAIMAQAIPLETFVIHMRLLQIQGTRLLKSPWFLR